MITRLLLAVYARVFAIDGPGARLLHGYRVHLEHVMTPPPRTFVAPPHIIAAVEKLEAILVAAAAAGRGVGVALGGENVYTLV